MGCAQSASEKQIADAIQASKEMAMQRECYTTAVARAMRESKAIAEAEAEEALQLKLALEASLAESDEKNLGLGLKPTPPKDYTEDLVNATSSTIQVCSSLTRSVAKFVETPSPCHAEPSMETALEIALAPTTFHVLKVLHESDMRRLRVQWAADASSIEVLAAVQSAVEDGFSLSDAEVSYILKYRDDEGDLCTLVEGTVADFLQVAGQAKAFKIVLEMVRRFETATDTPSIPTSTTDTVAMLSIAAASQEDFAIGT